MSRQLRSDAQRILDVMFEVVSRVHDGSAPRDRDALMEWTRAQLRNCGFDVHPMGLSHAVIQEPVLCKDDPDWDWWLKLPQEHRGAMVKQYRQLLKELGHGR